MLKKLLLCVLALLLADMARAEDRVQVPIGNSPVLGPEGAPVTIIEFIDFQ